MHARKYITGLAAAAVATSVMALTAGPAHAAYVADPDDSANVDPSATDLVGVGSDTIQGVDARLADAYNATSPASKVITYAATGTGDTKMKTGANMVRVVGSGAGKSLLHTGTNDTRIDFARSSSAQSAAETADGLQSFPFAVDTLIMVKSGQVASNAPASLTIGQIVSIYKGDVTNWSQIGGQNGVIKPLIPQSGSGTLSFFSDQLKAANGGVTVSFATSVLSVTEHDPSPIQNDPNAIAPFSLAKKSTLSNSSIVTAEPGFTADRAVYNVVRGTDLANPAITAAFSTAGYWCSATAKPIIEGQGFRQLLSPSQGGVCGQPTQNPTTNLTSAAVATTTAVTVTSAGASSAKIVATVTGSSAPSGTVTFSENGTTVAANVPLVSGSATATVPAAAGAHTYRAVFTPAANSAFLGSEGTGSGTVGSAVVAKASASVKAKFPKSVKAGAKAKGTVTVTLSSGQATGTITIKDGSKTVGKGTLSGGKVKITLKKLKPGKHKLTVSYSGSASANAGSATVKVTQLAPKKTKK